ncbi:hypothetical protein G7013_24385 [Pseudomonas viridiflava]|uniref:tetratricopeptide repeat protein n=2 Tax=Pseudomonas viridiflava TaxID=33069 RepID=UPI0015E3A735|nr:hypothetical protein [Pseudomonas viridiflava]MBA1232791.1 hypothetical protein [Pseudomonas viridiflava]
MNKLVVVLLLLWSFTAHAETKSFKLDPEFMGASQLVFASESVKGHEVLKGWVISGEGQKYNVPDVCEPEGGVAEISDAYVVNGKARYFVFTCSWSVSHPGIGLKGIQYETFIYTGSSFGSLKKETMLSGVLSGYEGSLEEGGYSYAWYVVRDIASKKIIELERGKTDDSLTLARDIALVRLKSNDYNAVKAYLEPVRMSQLLKGSPINNSNVTIYNDLGFALGQSESFELAYKVLSEVERVSPDRMVLKLNIADVLWGIDKRKAGVYYKEYAKLMREAGKERLIPRRVLERMQ